MIFALMPRRVLGLLASIRGTNLKAADMHELLYWIVIAFALGWSLMQTEPKGKDE